MDDGILPYVKIQERGNIGRNDISIEEFIINLRRNFLWNFKEKKDMWKDKKKNLLPYVKSKKEGENIGGNDISIEKFV